MDPDTRAKQLADVRASIDALDRSIIELLGRREYQVRRAGVLKADEAAVRAPGRVEQVINKVRSLAEAGGSSPDVAERTYRAMIAAFIELELSEHASPSRPS